MGNKFKVIHLAKNEAIIKGKKKGQVHYADTTQYNELKTNQAVAAAGQEMDDAIAAFFAPVVEAAEKFGESLLNSDSIDPDFTVVVRKGVEGVEGVAEQVITLTAELGSVLGHIDELQRLDLEGVQPTAHPLEMTNSTRPDVVVPGLSQEAALRNAPDSDGSAFLIPAITAGGDAS